MRSRARVGKDSLSINVLELFSIVWTAYVMIVIRKDHLDEKERRCL